MPIEKLHESPKPRSWLSDEVQARLRVPRANGQANDIDKDIEKAIVATGPINLNQLILDNGGRQAAIDALHTLHWNQFEKLIKWYFLKIGASSVRKPHTTHRGQSAIESEEDADVVALFGPLKMMICVQAKRYKNKSETNGHAVRQIRQYVLMIRKLQKTGEYEDIRNIYPWVITTGKFSEDAIKEAKIAERKNGIRIRLIEGDEFAEMILQAGIASIDQYDDK